MKILFYHTSDILNHHLGVLMDEAICMDKQGHEVYFATCNGHSDICYANSSCNKNICKLCKLSMSYLLRQLPKSIKILSLADYKTNNTYILKKEYNSIQDIKNIEYKEVKIGYAALSTYVTRTRNNNPIFDSTFRKYFDKVLITSMEAVDSIENMIKKINPDLVCVFNGRFYETRPAFEMPLLLGKQVRTYEVIGGYGEDYYKVFFENVMPHNIIENVKKVNDLWDKTEDSEDIKISIAKSFYENRRHGKPACDVNYTKNQQKGLLPSGWDKNKRNIAIFNSSEDEFIAIGDEYDRLAFFNSQIEGIKTILNFFKDNDKFHFYLRVHPNLANIEYGYHRDLYKLINEFPNITVIPANDKVSSYDLMDSCEKSIVFGSTMGMEAAYWGKPVILVGAAIYDALDICHKPINNDSLKDLILNNDLPCKNNIMTLKFGYYYMHRNTKDKYKYINFNKSYSHIYKIYFEIVNYQKILWSRRTYAFLRIIILKILNVFYPHSYIDIPVKGE